jgi:hypothetical protein
MVAILPQIALGGKPSLRQTARLLVLQSEGQWGAGVDLDTEGYP